jgi:hypothetical protein
MEGVDFFLPYAKPVKGESQKNQVTIHGGMI